MPAMPRPARRAWLTRPSLIRAPPQASSATAPRSRSSPQRLYARGCRSCRLPAGLLGRHPGSSRATPLRPATTRRLRQHNRDLPGGPRSPLMRTAMMPTSSAAPLVEPSAAATARRNQRRSANPVSGSRPLCQGIPSAGSKSIELADKFRGAATAASGALRPVPATAAHLRGKAGAECVAEFLEQHLGAEWRRVMPV